MAVDFLTTGRNVIQTEIDALSALAKRLNGNFETAVEMLIKHTGMTFITGMGKSGYIAQKMAATLASTGTPASFIHPSEALHGDIGMLREGDMLIAISNSGKTAELLDMLPYLNEHNIPVISICGNAESTLAKAAKVHLDASVAREACQNDLAPTASTTTALALCDALAIAASEAKQFDREAFALRHPAGSLGKRLLVKVSDLMHTQNNLPIVTADATIADTLIEMSNKRLGMTLVKQKDHVCGIFTDGDVRRAFEKGAKATDTITDYFTSTFQTINADELAFHAMELMQAKKITSLVVRNTDGKVEGILHIHDLLNAGLT